MERLSQLFDANRRDAETKMDSPQTSYPPSPILPQSPLSVVSSNSASPVTSIFSTKTHGRFPSTGSSIASSPVMGNSSEAFPTMKTQLTDVKEEPVEHEINLPKERDYFQDFNQIHADDSGYDSPIVLQSHEYDLSDDIEEVANSPKKRHADNATFKGISRISTRFSSMSSRWRQKNSSDTASTIEKYEESLRSRANSATSTLVSPTISSISRRQSHHSPSPARTVFEERLSEAGILPVDIDLANRQSIVDTEPQATTPLLPPVVTDIANGDNDSLLHSPLQSPSVADITDSATIKTTTEKMRYGALPSPPLSAQPSLSSIRPQPMDRRSQTVELTEFPPIMLADPNDEWSSRLGHANFTIQPEPYLPNDYTVEVLEEHRANWDLACHNYAKHLVRTGEHYGVTSNTYRLTQDKWRSINAQWKANHENIITSLESSSGRLLWLDKSNIRPGHDIKIPRLDKSKFPDLGDEDIVGPMEVAPPPQAQISSTGKSLRKRTFFKFLQDLFCVSDPKS